jgi:oxygen-independent coproporphyrinogen-3 oxidase
MMANDTPDSLKALLSAPLFDAYLYGYPHKTAYRPLDPPVSLKEAWKDEKKDALFLYLHIPFCEMRCGFCNLFTASRPPEEQVEAYLKALERQGRVVEEALEKAAFARRAIGGGTPTLLEPEDLERVFAVLERLGAKHLPTSVETSPATATLKRLEVLKAHGATRISMGIQSFFEEETLKLQRPQKSSQVEKALQHIRDLGFPTLNLDLIFGTPGQTRESFQKSIQQALEWQPEELYLYPLYVRPLTGMGRKELARDHLRMMEIYKHGQTYLENSGYKRVSLRMFRRCGASEVPGPVYRCQEDGMVGLGCGARSYTKKLHFASEYAVAPLAVSGIISQWAQQSDLELQQARNGIFLSPAEAERRRVILSILSDGAEGAVEDPGLRRQLELLVEGGLAVYQEGRFQLTEAGIDRSDAIGPWLYSEEVRQRMESYETR